MPRSGIISIVAVVLFPPKRPELVCGHAPVDALQQVAELAPVFLNLTVGSAELADEAMDAVLVELVVAHLPFLFLGLGMVSVGLRVQPRDETDRHDEPERESLVIGTHCGVAVVFARDAVAQVRDRRQGADHILAHGLHADAERRLPRGDDAELLQTGQHLGQRREDAAGVRGRGGHVVGAHQHLEGPGRLGVQRGQHTHQAAGLQVDVGDPLAGPAGDGAGEVMQNLRLVELEVLVLEEEERVAAQLVVDALADAQQVDKGPRLLRA
ncbi:hypothetical protein PG995_011332 [Apiospora arundinis]